MTENYYQTLVTKVQEMIDKELYQEAFEKLNEELDMPYVPSEVEKQLIILKEKVIQQLKIDQPATAISIEQIEQLLTGSELSQVKAVDALCALNLRQHIDVVKTYLENKPNRLVASILIEACIEQEITEELKYQTNEMIYHFVPRAIEKPIDTDGFKMGLSYLRQWLENDNPSLMMMCTEVLMHCVFYKLPESYEEDEAISLALSIVKYVYHASNDDDSYHKFVVENKLEQIMTFQLEGIQ